jgi:hypothetical protein
VAVHIYTQTIHRTTQQLGTVRAVPRLCEFYPGICLTTEEQARKTLSQGKKKISVMLIKTSVGVQYIYIIKNTHTLQNQHTHTYTHITKQYKTTTVQIKTKCT